MSALILALLAATLLLQPGVTGRTYYELPLERVARTQQTHVCTTGPVVYVRKQKDGDVHITLGNGKAKVVLEIIPAIKLKVPKKGQTIRACGIRRTDDDHNWPELHPLEFWEPVATVNEPGRGK